MISDTNKSPICQLTWWHHDDDEDDDDNDDDDDDSDDNDDDDDDDDDDLYIIGAVCMYVCDEKVTSSLICSATVAGEIYI